MSLYLLINYLDPLDPQQEKEVHELALAHISESWEAEAPKDFKQWRLTLQEDDENGWHITVRAANPKTKLTEDALYKVRDAIDRRGFTPDSPGLRSNWYCFVHEDA